MENARRGSRRTRTSSWLTVHAVFQLSLRCESFNILCSAHLCLSAHVKYMDKVQGPCMLGWQLLHFPGCSENISSGKQGLHHYLDYHTTRCSYLRDFNAIILEIVWYLFYFQSCYSHLYWIFTTHFPSICFLDEEAACTRKVTEEQQIHWHPRAHQMSLRHLEELNSFGLQIQATKPWFCF